MTTPSDVLRHAINYKLRSINSAIPAEITSYDHTQQKANVKPLLNKKYKDGQIIEMPVITAVPVIFPRGGNFSMHFPLSVGDSVLLIFSQRSLDEWVFEGGQVTPEDPRMFDLSDAIAIPGLSAFPNAGAEDNTNFHLNIGSSRIKVTPTGQFCFHGANEELMNIIDELLSALITLTQQPTPAIGTPITPLLTPTLNILRARFNTLKGDC